MAEPPYSHYIGDECGCGTQPWSLLIKVLIFLHFRSVWSPDCRWRWTGRNLKTTHTSVRFICSLFLSFTCSVVELSQYHILLLLLNTIYVLTSQLHYVRAQSRLCRPDLLSQWCECAWSEQNGFPLFWTSGICSSSCWAPHHSHWIVTTFYTLGLRFPCSVMFEYFKSLWILLNREERVSAAWIRT